MLITPRTRKDSSFS